MIALSDPLRSYNSLYTLCYCSLLLPFTTTLYYYRETARMYQCSLAVLSGPPFTTVTYTHYYTDHYYSL